MPGLNPSQKQAVQHEGSPLLVLAGAGSGKTRVITERIAWLINHRGIEPQHITALTFTNKAAREMKQRIGQLFSNQEQIQGLTVSTFHALGMRMIRRKPSAYGLRSGFSIVDRRDGIAIVAELMRTQPGSDNTLIERVLDHISRIKNATGAGQSEANPVTISADALFEGYQRYLRVCNSVDLDDLVYLPVNAMRDDPSLLEYWRQHIRYLLVDEYQDTNGLQYELVQMLAKEGRRLCVVGDDDQSIYAWRGAQPENLLTLKNDFPALNVVKLEQNYRSSNRILKVANQLIQNNPRPFDKSLWSELGYGDPISVFVADNEEHEAERVVSRIMKHQFQHNAPFSDFAILYRSNHLARILEIKCREMRIPYRISGGSSFFDRTEIRDVMAYLRLLTNPDDDAAFMRVINTPRRGIGPTSLEKIAALATAKQVPMTSVLDDIELATQVRPQVYKALQFFHATLEGLRQGLTPNNGADTLAELLKEMRYENWLLETGDADSARARWENIRLLQNWIEDAISKGDGEQTLAEVISDLVLSDLLDRQKEEEQDNQVNLMTLHAAKGLEFKQVFIVGVEEEILPHRVSVAEDSLDEERRLFYVGITRAMRHLTLSYTKKRKRFGEWLESVPSRFLDELPEDDLDREDDSTSTPENTQTTGRAHLANLRANRGTKT